MSLSCLILVLQLSDSCEERDEQEREERGKGAEKNIFFLPLLFISTYIYTFIYSVP